MIRKICFIYLAIVSSAEDEPKRYDNYSVWEAVPTDLEGLKYMQNLVISENDNFKVDFWQLPNGLNSSAEIMVDSKNFAQFETAFLSKHIKLNLLFDNVQQLIDNERKVVKNVTFKFLPGVKPKLPDSTGYPTLEEINDFLSQLPTKFPNLAERIVIATSHENRQINMIKITNKATNRIQKPAIWIDAGIHAREWITPVTALYTITKLLTEYDSPDENSKLYVDNLVWYIVPVLNPDGYYYSHSRVFRIVRTVDRAIIGRKLIVGRIIEIDRMWRKNRRPKTCKMAQYCCDGVDLNRNFGFKWSEPGASPASCTEVYHGPSAFSEPETRGVKDFILANKNSMKGFISLHSFGQLFLYPFGSSQQTYSSDIKELVINYHEHDPLKLVQVQYSASGISIDWAKAVANIKYSYTLELRPDSGRGSFILPTNQIMPTSVETWKAIEVIAKEIIERYAN